MLSLRDKISAVLSRPARSLEVTPAPTTSLELIASATQPLDIPREPPRLRQPQPAARQDRDGRVRHGLHAGAVQPGAHRGAVDARDAAQAGDGEGLPGGDPGPGLRPACWRCAGWWSIASTATSSSPIATVSRARARHGLATIDRAQDRRAVPARAHASVEPALRLDRLAVRAARGGAVRRAWSTTSIARARRAEARLHDAVGGHPRVHRPRAPRRIDQGDRQRRAAVYIERDDGARRDAAQVPLVGQAAVPADELGVGLHDAGDELSARRRAARRTRRGATTSTSSSSAPPSRSSSPRSTRSSSWTATGDPPS